MSLEDKKVEIVYPCQWSYKLILEACYNHKEIVKKIVKDKAHELRDSKNSNKGKYKSYNLTLLVHSEDERVYFFEEFKKDEKIKMVL